MHLAEKLFADWPSRDSFATIGEHRFRSVNRPCGSRRLSVVICVTPGQPQLEPAMRQKPAKLARMAPETAISTVTKITLGLLNLPYARSIKSPSGITARIRQ
ncbi:hypothetical protein [Bradyrhizobium sacchari]|uniref:hypothetical protein n=1 Tax=Bradyrhizobium sacchari TaxID=1399419 RepID=UPI0010A956F8|nr:hypothetical protein [Bradyrhizobium sacchari]